MSIDRSNINTVIGQPVHDADGQRIGEVGQVYLDDETGKPEWATVRTGLFGTKESFVPVAQARMTDDGLRCSTTRMPSRTPPAWTPTRATCRGRRKSDPTATTSWSTPRPGPTPGGPRAPTAADAKRWVATRRGGPPTTP